MSNTVKMDFNYTDVYSSADLATGCGYKLGDRVQTPLGEFVLSEAGADIARWQTLIMSTTPRFTVTDMTYTAATKLLYVADAGATVAQGALAGLQGFIYGDDSNQGGSVRIAKNAAGASGSAISIYLEEAYPTALGANPDLAVYDPNLVIISAVTDILQYCIGVSPVAVDQSDKPFFWRQVSGICPVIMDDTAAATEPINIGAAIAGQALVNATANGSDAKPFATILVAAPAANKLALARLHGTRS